LNWASFLEIGQRQQLISGAGSTKERQKAQQFHQDRQHILDDPQHWLDRAEEMRRLAEEMRDLQTRRMMLSIAQGYDKLAQRAQERAMGKVHKQSA